MRMWSRGNLCELFLRFYAFAWDYRLGPGDLTGVECEQVYETEDRSCT